MSFFIPFMLCILLLVFKGVFSDIEKIYVSDLSGQHLPFLNYFKGIMMGKESLEYSFRAGMGSSMLATVIFYCISPINILLLIISNVQYAIVMIAVVKISLSGLTMYIFLKNKFKVDKISTIIFSSCYAVSSFVINYFFCGFWFDSIYLAPLVMLGIERIYREEKINMLYIIALSGAIICNIQIGFALCIYSVIYFLYSFNIRYSVKRYFKKFIKMGVIFGISSLCAGAISSGILLGFMSEYSNIVEARLVNETTVAVTSNIFYIIKNLFSVGNLNKNYFHEFEPFIYCGLIVTYFSILYFLNRKISKKKKIHTFMVIMIFIISFSINSLNVFWHISIPVILNYRYAFYLSLFLTSISYECFLRRCRLSKNNINILIFISIVAFFILMMLRNEVYILLSVIFMVLILFFVILSRTKNKSYEKYLFIVVIIEIFISAYLSIYTVDSFSFITKKTSYDSMKKLISNNDFGDDYRVLYNSTYADYTNDGFLLNKNSSLRYFSSVISSNVIIFLDRNMAYTGWNNYRVSAYESPLLLSLLGNKYFYLTNEVVNGIYRQIDKYKVKSYDYEKHKYVNSDVYLYENPYALSIGYVIDEDVKFEESMDLVDYQNAIIKKFSGNYKSVVNRVDVEIDKNSKECSDVVNETCVIYYLKNNTDIPYIYINRFMNKWAFVKDYTYYTDNFATFMIPTLDREIELKSISDIGIVPEFITSSTYNREELINSLSILQENMLKNIQINKNVMNGEINSKKDGILFLSIPYDKRFSIYIDGKKVKYYSLLDGTFIGVDITKGDHKVSLKFTYDKYLVLCILASLISLIITFVIKYCMNRFIFIKK